MDAADSQRAFVVLSKVSSVRDHTSLQGDYFAMLSQYLAYSLVVPLAERFSKQKNLGIRFPSPPRLRLRIPKA